MEYIAAQLRLKLQTVNEKKSAGFNFLFEHDGSENVKNLIGAYWTSRWILEAITKIKIFWMFLSEILKAATNSPWPTVTNSGMHRTRGNTEKVPGLIITCWPLMVQKELLQAYTVTTR